jgi:type IV pilus assembly protein PilP
MRDLQEYVENVKNSSSRGVEPLPEVRPYKTFTYIAGDRRDPFDSNIFRPAIAEKRKITSKSEIRPDLARIPEYLENFPLDTLRMVGTMTQENQTWALVKTPDENIQRVAVGNHLGQNSGKILKVMESGIELVEIVPDGFGGWRERETSIALSE